MFLQSEVEKNPQKNFNLFNINNITSFKSIRPTFTKRHAGAYQAWLSARGVRF